MALKATVVLGMVVFSTPAAAEESRSSMAETLFVEGRRDIAEGRLEQALDRLKESQRLDPSPGTMLNIALCYNQLGKTASAWAAYREARRLAVIRGRDDVVVEAEKQAALLEPTLSYVTLAVSAGTPGLRVVSDGVEVKAGAFDTAMPVDAGEHVVIASAPGFAEWRGTVEVQEGARVRIVVPALRRLPTAPREVGDEASPPLLPWVLGGAGLATLVTAGAFGVVASDKHSVMTQCKNATDAATDCSSNANAAEREAGTFADWSTGLFVAGGALLAGGATWLVLDATQESRPGPVQRVSFRTGTGLWVQVEGRF